MTTAREIMAEATRRSVALAVEGDRLSWRAPAGAVTPDLIEGMKTHKAAILDALREPDIMARQRYGRPPDCEIPLTVLRPMLSDRDAELLTAFIERQPAPVVRWVCCQADRYDVAAHQWQPPAVREYAAMIDCLLWQWGQVLTLPDRASRQDRTKEAIQLLRDLAAGERNHHGPRSTETGKNKGTT
jgi:hypothetical protein